MAQRAMIAELRTLEPAALAAWAAEQAALVERAQGPDEARRCSPVARSAREGALRLKGFLHAL